MDIFISNTLEPDNFIIEDVISDNACMYRALANTFYYNSPYKRISTIIRNKNLLLEKI